MSFVYFSPERKSPIADFDKHELAAVVQGIFPSEIAELASKFILVLNLSGQQFLEMDEKQLPVLANHNQEALEILQNLRKSPPNYLTNLMSSSSRRRPSALTATTPPEGTIVTIPYDNIAHNAGDLFVPSTELQESEEYEAFDFSSDDDNDHPSSLRTEDGHSQVYSTPHDHQDARQCSQDDLLTCNQLIGRPISLSFCTHRPNKEHELHMPCDSCRTDRAHVASTPPSRITPSCLLHFLDLTDVGDRSLNVSEACHLCSTRDTSIFQNSDARIKICHPTLPVISTSNLTTLTSQNITPNERPATDAFSDLRICCSRQRGQHLKSDADSRAEPHPMSVFLFENRDGASSINISLPLPTSTSLASNMADGMRNPNSSQIKTANPSVVRPPSRHQGSQLAATTCTRDESKSDGIHPISAVHHGSPTTSTAINGKSGARPEPQIPPIGQPPSNLRLSDEPSIYEPISSFNYTSTAGIPERVSDPSAIADSISLPCHLVTKLPDDSRNIDLDDGDRPKPLTSSILALPTFLHCQDPTETVKMGPQTSSSTFISDGYAEGTSFKYFPTATAEDTQPIQYPKDTKRIKSVQTLEVSTPPLAESPRPPPELLISLPDCLPSLRGCRHLSALSLLGGSLRPLDFTTYQGVGKFTTDVDEEVSRQHLSPPENSLLLSSRSEPTLTRVSEARLPQFDHVISDKSTSSPTAFTTRSANVLPLSQSPVRQDVILEKTAIPLSCHDVNGDSCYKSTGYSTELPQRMFHPGISLATPMIKLDSHVPDAIAQNTPSSNLDTDFPEVGAMLGHSSQPQEKISTKAQKTGVGTVPELRPAALHIPIRLDAEDQPNIDLESDWMAVSDAQLDHDTCAKLSLSDRREFSLPDIPLSPPFSQEMSSSLDALSFDHSLYLSRMTTDASPQLKKSRHCLPIPSRSMPRTLWPSSNYFPRGPGSSHSKNKNTIMKKSALSSVNMIVGVTDMCTIASPSYLNAGTQTDQDQGISWETETRNAVTKPPHDPSSPSTLLPSDPSLLRELYQILGSSQTNGGNTVQEESTLTTHSRTRVNVTSKGLLPSFQGPINGISKGGDI